MSVTSVLVDAGHGGQDSGAVSHDGRLKEKDVALDVAKRVHLLLKGSLDSSLSRVGDNFLTLSQRASLANSRGAAMLSIHCNSGGGTGFECFTSPGQTSSDPWATAVLEDYHKAFPELAYRKDVQDGDPDKEARFTVLTSTKGPAILFELGFIDQKDTSFLEDEDNRQLMAWAIARATLKHFGATYDEEEPTLVEATTEPNKAEALEAITAIEWQLDKLKKAI